MCGICGIQSAAGVESPVLHRMLEVIAHRGPDDEGSYLNGSIGLGSRRLSIIDLEHGHQPICNENGSVWIVYNGEIYNYRELRQELLQKGHIFRTDTDTEVIVHLYEELGERCVEKLNGMFAFAIWDEAAQKLLLARDRLGQKPLFYAFDGEAFLFGSEIKAVLAARTEPPQVDYEALHHYLSLRFIPPPQTLFRGIQKLPPAHVLVYTGGNIRVTRYWDVSFEDKLGLSDAEYLERLQASLERTVESHLISDVPVGAFLSGGMDSSMMVALMARQSETPVHTFAVGVEEQVFNELPYARAVADHCQTRHTEAVVRADIVTLLPRMIWHLDEPSDPIAACQYYAAQLASRHVKVVVGGDGGDELFAGFDRYKAVGLVGYYARVPAFIRSKLIGMLLRQIPEDFAYKSLTQQMRWAHFLSDYPEQADRYAQATLFFRFSDAEKRALFSEDMWGQVGHLRSADVIADQYRRAPAKDPIDKMLYADMVTRLPEHSLMLTDRMTMAHGLEARSPFLDHTLVELMAAFPISLKIRGRETKYILRQMGKRYLPESILQRKKQGFMFPVAYWFRDELAGYLRETLLDSHLVKTGLFRRETVLQLIDEHQQRRADHHVRLWMLLNVELWHQLFIRQPLTRGTAAVPELSSAT